MHRVFVGDEEHLAKAVILAMGAEPKKLGVPGEDELASRGVSYCATCDAAFFRDKPTIVVGGGDTAMEDATFLAKFAKNVKIVHRRDEFRASAIMLDRARETDNIELVTPYVIDRFEAGENGSLGKVVLENAEDGDAEQTLEIDGAFIAIGHKPNSRARRRARSTPTRTATCEVEGRSTRTNLPGVFAAGDLVDHTYRQAVTAAGSGCAAALTPRPTCATPRPIAEAHWARRAGEDRGRRRAGGRVAQPSVWRSRMPPQGGLCLPSVHSKMTGASLPPGPRLPRPAQAMLWGRPLSAVHAAAGHERFGPTFTISGQGRCLRRCSERP